MAGSVNRDRHAAVSSGGATGDVIFTAALRLFRQRGFHGTSINQIGAAAGVTGPALYRHFAGKGEILAEAVRRVSRRIGDATRAALDAPTGTPRDALEALVRAYVEVALENADTYTAYVLEARHLGEGLRKPLRRAELRHRDEWVRLLRASDPGLSAEHAKAMVKMAMFAIAGLCMEPGRMDRAVLARLVTDRVMALLLAPRQAD